MAEKIDKISELFVDYIGQNQQNVAEDLSEELCRQFNISEEEDKEIFKSTLTNTINEAVLTISNDFIVEVVTPYLESKYGEAIFEELEDLEYKNRMALENSIENILAEYGEYMKNNSVNEYNQKIVDSIVDVLQQYNVKVPEEEQDYVAKLEDELENSEEEKRDMYESCVERDVLLKEYIKRDIIRKAIPSGSEMEIEKVFNLTESYDLDYNNLNKYRDHVLFVNKTYINKPDVSTQSRSKGSQKMPKLI